MNNNTNITKDQYIETLVKKLNEKLAPIVTAKHTTVQKNNGITLDGINFIQESCQINPVIYISLFIENMTDIDLAVETILNIYNHQSMPNIDIESFTDNLRNEDWLLANILPRLTSAPAPGVLCKMFLDLWITFYVRISDSMTVQITDKMTDLNPIYLWDAAEKNMKHEAISMPQMMTELGVPDLSFDDDFMFILSNPQRIYGATAMLDKKLLSDLADRLDSSLYILPSSIHEVIAIPTTYTNSIDDLRDMVSSVNENEVSQSDFLSNSVYLFIKDRSHLQIAC